MGVVLDLKKRSPGSPTSWGRAASAPGRTDLGVSGVVGALAMEAALCPACASILHQGCTRRNPVFALISCQVFPLVAPSDAQGLAWQWDSILGSVRGAHLLLLLLVRLLPLLAVKTRQNADLAGGSFVLNFTGGVLDSCEMPRLGLGGRGSEIQLDG